MSVKYIQKKKAIQFMINHYEEQRLNNLDYAAVYGMTIDELTILYEYNDDMVDRYQQELLLLEAQNILQLV